MRRRRFAGREEVAYGTRAGAWAHDTDRTPPRSGTDRTPSRPGCSGRARRTGSRRPSGGRGLPGMAERARCLGGTADAGPADGVWRLAVRIPR
ncbi:hypothetical protein ACFQ9J_33005 [Streptomyces sp. NPDC056529]|uniref:hypothetical protein n=1 Tax=Streptomyces sp. NPDC056529 TaxID=3345855 RepID=UPI0036CEA077